VKRLFVAASALFAVLPGLLVVARGVGTPPGYETVFGGVIEACGVIALLTLSVNRAKIRQVAPGKATRIVIFLAIGFTLTLFLYIYLFNLCVVTVKDRGTAYYPVVLSGEIADTVAYNGSRRAAIEKEGIDTVLEEIDKLPDWHLIATTIVLLFVYQLVFTLLTVAFGFLGFNQVDDPIATPSAGRHEDTDHEGINQ
jgi:hypothetical protein